MVSPTTPNRKRRCRSAIGGPSLSSSGEGPLWSVFVPRRWRVSDLKVSSEGTRPGTSTAAVPPGRRPLIAPLLSRSRYRPGWRSRLALPRTHAPAGDQASHADQDEQKPGREHRQEVGAGERERAAAQQRGGGDAAKTAPAATARGGGGRPHRGRGRGGRLAPGHPEHLVLDVGASGPLGVDGQFHVEPLDLVGDDVAEGQRVGPGG